MASDDWRVTVTLHGEELRGKLGESLEETEVEEEARAAARRAGMVGGGEDAGVVFLYTGTPRLARGAGGRPAVRRRARGRGRLRDPPLAPGRGALGAGGRGAAGHRGPARGRAGQPRGGRSNGVAGARLAALGGTGRARLARATRRRSPTGSSPRRTTPFRIHGLGRASLAYLLIGAESEDQANEIAARCRRAAGGRELHVEPSGALVWQQMKPSPFAVLGGLGT